MSQPAADPLPDGPSAGPARPARPDIAAPDGSSGPEAFRGQFVLGTPPLWGRPGWPVHPLGARALAADPGCPVIEVSDARGARVGYLLGHPVDLARRAVLREPLRLAAALEPGGDLDAFVEAQIYALGGSFLFVLDHAGRQRVYLDAGGSMSAVFDPESRRVAATTGLLLTPRDYAARFDRDLHAFLRVERDGWFPAGLTAHAGIRRILANHYLDLESWTQHRHWPRAQVPAADDPVAACRRVAANARATIDALRADGSVVLALTGGKETRMMLAVCRDIAPGLDFATVDNPHQHLDRTLVGRLVARFGLSHRFVPAVAATPAETDAYLRRAGHCVGGLHPRNFPSLRPLTRYDHFVNGLGGGVAAGFFWRGRDTAATPLDARGMATRLGMPVHDRVVAEMGPWIEGVADLDTYLKLDLAFVEHRLGCWSFANAYGEPDLHHVHPLISRSSIQAIVSLPPDWRRGKRLADQMIGDGWPELLEIPVNRYGDLRDQLRFLRRLATSPHLIGKKIRKKLA